MPTFDICRKGASINDIRKMLGFFDPLPPCPRWETGLYYKIHATSLTLSAFPLSPRPLGADVINGWPFKENVIITYGSVLNLTQDRDFRPKPAGSGVNVMSLSILSAHFWIETRERADDATAAEIPP